MRCGLMLGVVAAVLLGTLVGIAGPVRADTCQCRSDPRSNPRSNPMSGNRSYVFQSGPPGICAVAQDRGFCAQAQIQRPVRPSDPGRFDYGGPAAALRRLGARLALDEALDLAAKTPPERWTAAEAPDIVTAILANVLWLRLDELGEIYGTLREQAGTVQALLASTGTPEPVELGPYRAVAGYGCIELSRGTFRALVRTPFAGEGACSPRPG